MSTLDGQQAVRAQTICVERVLAGGTPEQSCARIKLGGSKGNIVTAAMMKELSHALRVLINDESLKAIIIVGEGKHFSFGASVEEHKREFAGEMIRGFHKLILDIAKSPVPIIAMVSGFCLGGAMELALACNMIFADETATFGQPEIQLGVFPPPASVLLPLKLGYGRAEEPLMTGENIPAELAYSIGLVNKLFHDREAMTSGIDTWMQKHILPKSAAALRFAVRAERMRFADVLEASLPKLERLYVNELMATHDANEGIAAFLEKRSPVWTNS